MIEPSATIHDRHSATYCAAKAAEFKSKRLGLEMWPNGEVEFNGMVVKYREDGKLMVASPHRLTLDFIDGRIEISTRI